ncbi:MAG: J domain-containing protein [Chloroflexi bacterium]|nr:MAG: J domain-containing protein [Chloroflexota bacterium]
MADYYFVLGVPPDATEAELHAAWRRQLKYWHPDRGNHPDALGPVEDREPRGPAPRAEGIRPARFRRAPGGDDEPGPADD